MNNDVKVTQCGSKEKRQIVKTVSKAEVRKVKRKMDQDLIFEKLNKFNEVMWTLAIRVCVLQLQ